MKITTAVLATSLATISAVGSCGTLELLPGSGGKKTSAYQYHFTYSGADKGRVLIGCTYCNEEPAGKPGDCGIGYIDNIHTAYASGGQIELTHTDSYGPPILLEITTLPNSGTTTVTGTIVCAKYHDYATPYIWYKRNRSNFSGVTVSGDYNGYFPNTKNQQIGTYAMDPHVVVGGGIKLTYRDNVVLKNGEQITIVDNISGDSRAKVHINTSGLDGVRCASTNSSPDLISAGDKIVCDYTGTEKGVQQGVINVDMSLT